VRGYVVRIIYITSRGQSGSTLLDLLISGHDDVVSVGEAKVFDAARRRQGDSIVPESVTCSCGAETLLACGFWRQVDQRIRSQSDLSLARLELSHPDQSVLEAHNFVFFTAVSEVSGRSVIVDSSKSVDRLERLLGSKLFEVQPIHLYRSAYGIAYSAKKRRRDWKSSIKSHTYAFLRVRALLREIDHSFIRYEDLSAEPDRVVADVMAWLGFTFNAVQMDWTAGVRHNAHGSPVRFSQSPAITPDMAWRNALNWREKATIWWMSLPTRLPGKMIFERSWPLWSLGH